MSSVNLFGWNLDKKGDVHLEYSAFVGLEKELNCTEPDNVFDPAVSYNFGFVVLEKLDKFEAAIVGDDVTAISGATGLTPEEIKQST